MSGARCVSTLLNEMKRRGKDCRFGVISMCIGDLIFYPSTTHKPNRGFVIFINRKEIDNES